MRKTNLARFGVAGNRMFQAVAIALSLGWSLGMAQVQVAASSPVIAEAKGLSASGAAAETSEGIQGPVLGYVVEGGVQLRPILGIAGSSHLGNPIPFGLSLQKTVLAPGQDSLLGVDGNGDVHFIDLRTGSPARSLLAGADRGADQIAFSPGGQSAALYDRESKQVQLVKGLPGAPQVSQRVSLASLPGILTALAVNDEGNWLLAAVSEQPNGSLYAVGSNGASHYLAPAGTVSGLAFVAGTNDAIVADHGRNEVVLLRNVAAGAQPMVLASEQDGLRNPVAVAASSDGSRVFAALGGSRQVAALPLEGGVPTFTPCDCAPTSLERLRGANVFRLTQSAGQAVFLLDAGNNDPKVWFVPPSTPPALPAGDSATPRPTRGR